MVIKLVYSNTGLPRLRPAHPMYVQSKQTVTPNPNGRWIHGNPRILVNRVTARLMHHAITVSCRAKRHTGRTIDSFQFQNNRATVDNINQPHVRTYTSHASKLRFQCMRSHISLIRSIR